MTDYPKLRANIDLVPFEHNQQRGFLLRDNLVRERALFISQEALRLLSFFDGRHTVRDIQYEITRQTGGLVMSQEIEKVIQLLDDNFFLESERYREWLSKLYEEYRSSPARPSIMAGSTYPAEKEELQKYLNEIFAAASVTLPPNLPDGVKGVVVPHIDIERGKTTYTTVYECLRKYHAAETYIILGVNHSFPTDNPFIVTDRDYETPLGRLAIDKELLDRVKGTVEWDILKDEIAHRGEHSVELVALFLSYLYPKKDLRILPVLCGFEERDDPRVGGFIEALKPAVQGGSGEVVIIASVDFSHIGPQFGWNRQVTAGDRIQVEEEDRRVLQHLVDGSADEFYEEVVRGGNPRHIDAHHACYTMLKLLEGRKGTLLHYEQAFHPVNTVTVAGLIF